MIAGGLGAGHGRVRDPGRAAGPEATHREAGALRLAWNGGAEAHEADGLLVVLDGFLLGPMADLANVAEAWRRAGNSVTDQLQGAFTIVIWDGRSQRGIVACDHFSLRVCLMHGTEGGTLRFSTHLPTLRRMLASDPGPEPQVIVPWIAPQYLQGHKTMLAGVERVGGARLLELSAGGWRRRRYWRPTWNGTLDAPRAELAAMLRSELARAVAQRLAPHTPTGTILSGGLDSSVVLATAAALEPRPDLRAYSTVFPDWPAADESQRIAATTGFLDVPASRFVVRPQGALRMALEQLRDSGTVPGGPGGLVERPGVRQAAADGVHVLFDGQGGDEVFGSSPYLLADRLRRGNVRGAVRLLRRTVPYLRRRTSQAAAWTLLRDFGLSPALPRRARVAVARRGVRGHHAPEWLTAASGRTLSDVHQPWPWIDDESDVPRWWAYQSYLLTDHVEGSGLGEHMWERAAPFGMRSAAPLFDLGLVQLVLRMPPEATWQRVDRSLAREAVAGRLPEAVRNNRRKANIGPFYLDLLTGPDNTIVRELLLDPRARVRGFVDPVWLDRSLARLPTRADADWLMWTTVAWRLAMAECWLRWLEEPGFPESMLDRPDLPEVSARPAT